MEKFLEISIELSSDRLSEQEIVLALLGEYGFSGFEEEEGRIRAYLRESEFSEVDFETFLDSRGIRDRLHSMRTVSLPETNWNAAWEKEYPPVHITDRCTVRAPFHSAPENLRYDLVISPKMSFGTAHHETTRLMLRTMLSYAWDGLRVLDFGCGTGVLAILAEKMGAGTVVAVDKDEWAYRNACENVALNHCKNIHVVHGELGSLDKTPFHAVLANISLNVLNTEMENLTTLLTEGGIAMLSGFYENDMEILGRSAFDRGLTPVDSHSMNEWVVAVYRKAD